MCSEDTWTYNLKPQPSDLYVRGGGEEEEGEKFTHRNYTTLPYVSVPEKRDLVAENKKI